MAGRELQNAAAATGEVASLIGLLPKLFDAVGWIEWAQGLGAVMALFQTKEISWTGVYLVGAIFFASWGVAINFDVIAQWHKRRKIAALRHWDLPAIFALDYIVNDSNFGLSLTDDKRASAFIAFLEACKTGKLELAGKLYESQSLVAIPKRAVRDQFLFAKKLANDNFTICTSGSKDDVDVIYHDIFVDERQVKEIWPRNLRPRTNTNRAPLAVVMPPKPIVNWEPIKLRSSYALTEFAAILSRFDPSQVSEDAVGEPATYLALIEEAVRGGELIARPGPFCEPGYTPDNMPSCFELQKLPAIKWAESKRIDVSHIK